MILSRQDKLISLQKTAKQCATRRRKPRKASDHPRRRDFKTPEGFNECGIDAGRSYASRAGERMEKKQSGFPDETRHAVTIMLLAVSLDGNAKLSTDICRPRMRACFINFTFGAQIEGNFQFVLKTAAEVAAILPASELPPNLDAINRPDDLFALLHWHGIVADPHLTKRKVRKIISDAFVGNRRVCVRKIQPERINAHGQITHGGQGYFEYSALQKTEIKFNTYQQTKAAILGYAILDSTWTKKNRQFSMGKPLAITGVKIDPSRVIELQVMERLDFVKKYWDKLSYGEQFIHLWFSGMINIIGKPQVWLKHGSCIRERFFQALGYIKNWSTDTAQDIDFLDYVEIPLE